jgi:hypothetical protein
MAVLAGSRPKKTYFGAKYRRIAARRGPMKALVAVEHAIHTAAWNMLRTGGLYNRPGQPPRTRLLHPPAAGQNPRPRHQPARSHGLHRHHRTRTTSRLTRRRGRADRYSTTPLHAIRVHLNFRESLTAPSITTRQPTGRRPRTDTKTAAQDKPALDRSPLPS